MTPEYGRRAINLTSADVRPARDRNHLYLRTLPVVPGVIGMKTVRDAADAAPIPVVIADSALILSSAFLGAESGPLRAGAGHSFTIVEPLPHLTDRELGPSLAWSSPARRR